MAGLFSRKSPLEKLESKHKKILEDAFRTSQTNRAAGDTLYAQANEVEKEIEKLRAAQ